MKKPSAADRAAASADRAAASAGRAVASAFHDAQRSSSSHARASRDLSAVYDDADPAAFLSAFLHALNRALVVFTREPAVENVVAFVAAFAAHLSGDAGGGGGFSVAIISYLAAKSGAANKAVRFRCCQVLAGVLQALPDDAAIEDEVWDAMTNALLLRVGDKIERVRAAAAGALCRLQVSGEAGEAGNDSITKTLVAILATDSSSSVRKAALAAVAVNETTVSAVFRRTRDVKEDVRRVAYGTLASRWNVEDLIVEDRVELLQAGLKDRSKAVRAVVAEKLLVDNWLAGACEWDVSALVELLGGREYEEEVLQALRIVFASPKGKELVAGIEIDINNLTAASVMVLRAIADVESSASRIEELVDSALTFSSLLRYYGTDEFATRQLLAITRRIDLADEAGRRAVEEALHFFFLASSEVNELVIPDAVAAMRLVMMSEDAASRLLVEIILNDVLPSAGEAETDAEGGKDRDPAGEDEDDWVSIRALTITKELLRHANSMASALEIGNGLYLSLKQQVIVPRLTASDGALRHSALEALALFCLLDSSGSEARSHLPIFVTACRNDNEDIQALALHILADLFMVFDFSGDEEGKGVGDKDGNDSDGDDFHSACGDSPGAREAATPVPAAAVAAVAPVAQVVALFTDYITHVDGSLRYAAIEALARLLFSRRVTPTPKLLSKILLAYYNPVNVNEVGMRQCLSVFFPSFAFSASQHRLALEAAFIPTLRVLLDAPKTSPLVKIPPLVAAQYLLHLTNPSSVPTPTSRAQREVMDRGDLADKAATTHERIAESLFHHLLDLDEEAEPETFRLFAKVVSSLRLVSTLDNGDALARLRKLSQAAIDNTEDKRSLVPMRKFGKHIQSLVKSVKGNGSDDGEDCSVEKLDEGANSSNNLGDVDSLSPSDQTAALQDSFNSSTEASASKSLPPKPPSGKRSVPLRQRAVNQGKRSKDKATETGATKGSQQDGSIDRTDVDCGDGEDDEEENKAESPVVDQKPALRSRPRRAARERRSYVEVPVIDLESESEGDDSSYNGESD